MKKLTSLLALIIVLPFLLSLSPSVYEPNYNAKYTSPEGIIFLSYSKKWDKDKLQDLYKELLKNKHGNELFSLQEVRVRGGSMPHSPYTTGRFNMLTNTIDLFHGDEYTKATSYRKTLSHEYGHLFTYHYLTSFHFPFSKWAKLRELKNKPVHWDAFWNYGNKNHDWYPEEIMAEDYVLLYGSTKKVDLHDVYSNEAFYLQTQHDNQQLSNVLENKQLQQYLEDKTGIDIGPNRLLHTPKLTSIQNQQLSFSVTKRKDICYRLNLTFYEKENGHNVERNDDEQIRITSDTTGMIAYPLQKYNLPQDGYVKVSINVLDLNTSIGFQTEPTYITIQNNRLTSLTTKNIKE